MRPSSLATDPTTLPTRRLLAVGLAVAALASLVLPQHAGAAPAQDSIQALRAQRTELVRQIATLTDTATRAQARAAEAGNRRALAMLAAETARRDVARYAVDAYVDGVQTTQEEQLQRQTWADLASRTDRQLFATLAATRDKAHAEQESAQDAVELARTTTASLQQLRQQLESTIADREEADAAADRARRLATPATKLTTRPRFSRSTRVQGELLRSLPFGPVSGIPDGLAATGQVVAGKASWYGPGFDGRPTASGAIFDQEAFTVASKELPLGTILLITYGGRSVLVLVNDRGPYVAGRVLDLSHGVASALGTVHAGVARVTAQVLGPA
jgi:rare lipoprotein A (peptidoglycan hydrolase)